MEMKCMIAMCGVSIMDRTRNEEVWRRCGRKALSKVWMMIMFVIVDVSSWNNPELWSISFLATQRSLLEVVM
jgi:hypothetical protein